MSPSVLAVLASAPGFLLVHWDHISVTGPSRAPKKRAHFVPLNVELSAFDAVPAAAASQNSLALARLAVTSCFLLRLLLGLFIAPCGSCALVLSRLQGDDWLQ